MKLSWRYSAMLLASSCLPAAAQMSVSLQPSTPSPAPLGTVVTWSASIAGAEPGTITFRFRTRLLGSNFHTLVDYGPKSSVDWSTIAREGSYEIEVTAQNGSTGETAAAKTGFR